MEPDQEKLLVVIVLIIASLFAVGVVGWLVSPMSAGGWGMMGFGFPFMTVFMFLVPVAVILFIVWLVRESSRGYHVEPPSRPRSSLEILKERYARGEITEEQFEKMKKTLGY
ncbi:MAG: SHOCT domain-containing protein [Candidatus Geothermarchaeales archaeon]